MLRALPQDVDCRRIQPSHTTDGRAAVGAKTDLMGSRPCEIEDLAEQCRRGDKDAWNSLFYLAWPILVTFIHRLYHSFDKEDAEDVAQLSLHAAISNVHRYSGDGLFRAWLFGIASNQATSFHRKHCAKKRGLQLLVAYDSDADFHDDSAKSPAENLADRERASILHIAINELNESDRDLVHLHFFGELTFNQIAEVRQMNPKTVCTRLTRAKEKLLRVLVHNHLVSCNG
jgi:RNA polymerase sigma-70 factor (ECF subfamily)